MKDRVFISMIILVCLALFLPAIVIVWKTNFSSVAYTKQPSYAVSNREKTDMRGSFCLQVGNRQFPGVPSYVRYEDEDSAELYISKYDQLAWLLEHDRHTESISVMNMEWAMRHGAWNPIPISKPIDIAVVYYQRAPFTGLGEEQWETSLLWTKPKH